MPHDQPIITEFVDWFFAQNSRVVRVEGLRDCWIIDPGLPPATSDLLGHLSSNDLTPKAVVLTHAHADHIAGVPGVLEAFSRLPVYLAREEWSFLGDPEQNLSAWSGMGLRVEVANLLDLQEGQNLELGGSRWRVLDTSGHSPGGRTLYCAEHGLAIVGDSLFAGSIGRTDFPHSDHNRLITNIREKLLTLPGDTVVYPGHGPLTTIDVERDTNPFL